MILPLTDLLADLLAAFMLLTRLPMARFASLGTSTDLASPTSSFLRTKLFCINGLVLLLVTIYGLHPCISG